MDGQRREKISFGRCGLLISGEIKEGPFDLARVCHRGGGGGGIKPHLHDLYN